MLFFLLSFSFPNRSAKTGINNRRHLSLAWSTVTLGLWFKRQKNMKMQPSPSFFFYLILVNLCHCQDLCFFFFAPCTTHFLCRDNKADLMYYLATTTLFSSKFLFVLFLDIFLPVPSCTLLSPDWFPPLFLFSLSLSCPLPLNLPLPLSNWIRVWLHHGGKKRNKSATLYFSTIRNGCVLPLFVHLGATLPCVRSLTVPTGFGGSQRQCRTWRLCDNKTSMVYLFFIQNRQNLYFLAYYYWQFSFQKTCFLEP